MMIEKIIERLLELEIEKGRKLYLYEIREVLQSLCDGE